MRLRYTDTRNTDTDMEYGNGYGCGCGLRTQIRNTDTHKEYGYAYVYAYTDTPPVFRIQFNSFTIGKVAHHWSLSTTLRRVCGELVTSLCFGMRGLELSS